MRMASRSRARASASEGPIQIVSSWSASARSRTQPWRTEDHSGSEGGGNAAGSPPRCRKTNGVSMQLLGAPEVACSRIPNHPKCAGRGGGGLGREVGWVERRESRWVVSTSWYSSGAPTAQKSGTMHQSFIIIAPPLNDMMGGMDSREPRIHSFEPMLETYF